MRRFALLAVVLLAMCVTAKAASERTYYGPGRMKALRENLEKHDWAKAERDKILAAADKWLKYDDARLRTLVTPPEVARAVVAHTAGAPENGDALNRKGRYSWIIDFESPWKVKSPIDGKVYPSNDFEAYMKSGYTDRSLLTGPYADDGHGCKVEGFDKPFWFVGVYAHWSVTRLLLPAIENLSKAYLITDDPKYAHACAVLLYQLAEYYPRYQYEKQSRYAKEVKPDYLGRLLYHTWESLYTCHVVPPAYDAIRPALAEDAALLKLSGLNAEALRAFIEERLLITMANDIMDGSGRIAGNYGMHQVALLRIAAVLKNRTQAPMREDMVQWVVGTNANATSYVQLGLEDAINNLIYRDGYPFENPGYNTHWSLSIGEIVSELGEDAQRFIAMPRFRKLYTWPIQMAVCVKYSPAYGDGGNIWNAVIGWDKRVMVPGYRFYRDPLMAKALVTYYKDARVSRDLFEETVQGEMEDAARTLKAAPGTESVLMPGVGFGSLQADNGGNRVAATLFYGYYWGHRHYDSLTLDFFSLHKDGWGYSWLPDLGYPETADSYDPRRFGFLSHTICHNTVMIDAARQEPERGRLYLYDRGPFVRVMEASAEAAYPKTTSLYRRTLMLVDVDPENAYLVDIFRVRGGAQHDWLIHGTDAAFTSDLPFTPPRTEGTLAGPTVKYGEFYDDKRFADNNKAHVPYYQYKGSAFQWLFNVQEAKLNGVQTVQWNRGKAFMRAHLLPASGAETVYACDGTPQRRKPYPDKIKFVVRRRTGDKNLESVFVTVFEPYKEKSFIRSVRLLPVEENGVGDGPVALEVDLGGGRKQVIFSRMERTYMRKTPALRLPGVGAVDARAAVVELRDGAVVRTYSLGETAVDGKMPLNAALNRPRHDALVESVDYEKGVVTLAYPILKNGAAEGQYAIVESTRHANAVPVAKILDERRFSVGDDDLCAGRVHVSAVKGAVISFLPKQVWFLEPGMTVVNEAGAVVGRIQETVQDSGAATLTRKDARLEDFPDLDGDGRRTVRIGVVGPGDSAALHRAQR